MERERIALQHKLRGQGTLILAREKIPYSNITPIFATPVSATDNRNDSASDLELRLSITVEPQS